MLEKRKHKLRKTICIYGIIILTVIITICTIYIYQRNTLINLRRGEMISIAKISGNNLKSYFEGQIKYLDDVFLVEDDLAESGIDITSYIQGKILSIEENNDDYEFDMNYIPYELLDKSEIDKFYDGKCVIGHIKKKGEYDYSIEIYKPILIKGRIEGIISVEYLLNEVYKETLGEIQVGKYGYCTLKDKSGAILMHGKRNQIGLNSLEDRKEKYPELDPEGIERLVNNQLSGKTGSDIVKSYWWGENEVRQVKKIIGYTPIEIGDHELVISAITSYDEIAIPIAKTFYSILIFGTFLLIIIVSFIAYIIKIRNQQEKTMLELEYSEKLNKTTNMLRKHEEKLSKINSIHTLGMMASTVAHEFKNLLTPIFIYTEMLAYSLKDNDEAIEDLSEIKNAADNCLELSKNILSYSKEDKEGNKEWFDSCKEVINILNILKVIIPPNIDLHEDIIDKKICLYGNRREFKQIALNIITNAYQSMEIRGGELRIRYYVEDIRAVLVISDTGSGIEEEMVNKIFEPFYTSKADGGTGLGLSIVMELLKNNNGTMKIESEKDIGTTVKIEFNNIKIESS